MIPDVAKIAALIGDAVRAQMLFALLDGRELAASELACRGGASPQAASGHLSKLVEGGLIRVRTVGRRRLFTFASDEVANAIEGLASIAPVLPVTSLSQQNAMQRLRHARTCYDHLAGQLGVGVTESLGRLGALEAESDAFVVTAHGEKIFNELGVDVSAVRGKHRHFARACMDWTERRHHLAGALGAELLDRFIESDWLRRDPRDRSLQITTRGSRGLADLFGITAG